MRHEHILIMRFSAMGDVAMTVPVVSSLAKTYPNVRITVLSSPFAQAFFEGLAPNVFFMAADIKKEYRGIKGLNALYRRLAAKNFTCVADLHGVLRSRFLRMRFNVAHYRVAHIDKHRKGRYRLVSMTDKRLEQQPTSFKNYADVLAKLGYPVKIEFKSIFPPSGGDISLLPAAIPPKSGSGQWIGIAPFAAHVGKIYPPRLMRQVIDALVAEYPQCRIFLFGRGKDESRYFTQWCDIHRQCTAVCRHAATMRQELVIMSHLDVMVSMDSANMHLASLVATPVVSVWGATHPFAGFMGFGQSADNAVQLDLPCRPCSAFGQKPCRRGDYACMNNIAPESIVARVSAVLSGNVEH